MHLLIRDHFIKVPTVLKCRPSQNIILLSIWQIINKRVDWLVDRFGYLPEFYLKKYILESFPDETENPEAVDFVVDQVRCYHILIHLTYASLLAMTLTIIIWVQFSWSHWADQS
jgi:hypothetical protein